LDSSQVNCHESILYTSNTTQIWENILKDIIPIPLAISEFNFGIISHLKPSTTTKLPPTPPDIFPKTHLI
jgi:hypothetical protein